MAELMDKRFIIITGPTGVGKSETMSLLGKSFPIEVVNCDIGSFYQGCTIGTAKPQWKKEIVPHHLFDCIDTPRDCSVAEYRSEIVSVMNDIWKRGALPVLVGGSGFYIKSLFFPPRGKNSQEEHKGGTWEELNRLDPQRAKTIHPNDHYRINRALFLLYNSNRKASDFKPVYQPLPGKFLFLFLTRDREELYERINKRVLTMMEEGWIEEVRTLKKNGWENFLERKKLIGYNDILSLLKKETIHQDDMKTLIQLIQKRTRHYAKRQITFWKSFYDALEENTTGNSSVCIREINFSKVDGPKTVWKAIEGFFSYK